MGFGVRVRGGGRGGGGTFTRSLRSIIANASTRQKLSFSVLLGFGGRIVEKKTSFQDK